MIPIPSLLATTFPWDIRVRALPTVPVDVTRVALVEDLAHVHALERGALVVLTRATIEAAGGYQLDVFVRQAIRRESSAIVLRRSTAHSLTAEALAERGGIALLDVDDDVDPATVVDELSTLVAGDVRAAVRLLAAASAVPWVDQDAHPAEVVQRVGRACGITLEYVKGETVGGSAVVLEGKPVGVVKAHQPGDLAVIATRLGAEAASAVLARRERLVLMPVRTTSAALSQLLLCSQANLPAVAERAAEVGLGVSGWHCAARLTVEEPGGTPELGLPGLEQELIGLVAEYAAPSDAGHWSVARPDDSIVLAHTTRQSAGGEASGLVRDWIGRIASILVASHPGVRIRVGIGTVHEGPGGLRVSAEEARAALAAARLADDAVSMSSFDALGGRRMLAEWLTTEAAREAVRQLLAPLDAQGTAKSATAVATLHAYLDEQGSLQRAAARLHVHRNAVVYRLERIKALGLDLTDADNRFALQMACRARLMSTGRLE